MINITYEDDCCAVVGKPFAKLDHCDDCTKNEDIADERKLMLHTVGIPWHRIWYTSKGGPLFLIREFETVVNAVKLVCRLRGDDVVGRHVELLLRAGVVGSLDDVDSLGARHLVN